MWSWTLLSMLCKQKVILCSFIPYFLLMFVLLKALHGLELTARVWEQHLSYLCEEVVCFVHAHLPQLLQPASSTGAVVTELQQNGFYFSMHNHHHFSCHLPCKHAIQTGSAEQEGRPDSLVSSKKTREKNWISSWWEARHRTDAEAE